uniref:Uncharacterized protein n=1 Tax=Arundo donax TaxID=35708 RepID=A0A0A9AVX0_ARUDO
MPSILTIQCLRNMEAYLTGHSHRHPLGGRHNLFLASDMVKLIAPFFPYRRKGGCIPSHPCHHSSLGCPCRDGSPEAPCRMGSPEAPCRMDSPVAPCRKSTLEVETCGSHCHNTHHDHRSLCGISHGLYAHTDDQDSFQELASLDDLGVKSWIYAAIEGSREEISYEQLKLQLADIQR